MRVFPKSVVRPLLLVLVGGILILVQWRANQLGQRIHDDVGVMSKEQRALFDEALDVMQDAYGVDIRYFIFADSQAFDARTRALREARARRVGGEVGGRGIVVVIDYATHRMAIQVGPQLEGVMTDGFTGYLLRHHLAFFNRRADAEIGLRALTFLLAWRIEESLLGNEWDPRIVTRVRDSTRLAMGGGAQLEMSDSLDPRARPRLPEPLRSRFGPQPSPRMLLERYRQWTTLDLIDHRVGLFTDRSQAALDATPYTRPFLDLEFYKTQRHQYEFVIRDSLAVMYSTTSPIITPSFMRRSAAGWQFDVFSEWQCIGGITGSGYTWSWQACQNPFDGTFYDQLVDLGGIWRMAGGDNRPLPSALTRYEGRNSLWAKARRFLGLG